MTECSKVEVSNRRLRRRLRNAHFLKITTEDGIVGWSDSDKVLARPWSARDPAYSALVIDRMLQHERIYSESFSATLPVAVAVVAAGAGVRSKPLLLDAKAKKKNLLGVPCYDSRRLRSGARSRVYWSIAPPAHQSIPALQARRSTISGVKAIGRDVREKKFTPL